MNANRVAQRQGLGGLAICRAWIARLAGFAVLLTAGSALAQAPNSIEQVTVTRGAAGLHDRALHAEGTARQSAGRLRDHQPAADRARFPGHGERARPNNQRAVDDPALRSLQFVQAGNRTRVVFNLNKPQTFDTKVEGNAVWSRWPTAAEAARKLRRRRPVCSASPKRAGADQQHALRDVDFRRGRNGEGRIVVDLSDSNDRHRHPPAGPAR